MEITIFVLVVLFFSIIIHEIAHGSVALSLGDTTAKDSGRLTLNPLSHIDPFGTIILPLILIFSYSVAHFQGPVVGWAKPVPVNPFNLRDKKWGMFKVSLAGPATNFLIALIFGLIIRFVALPQTYLLLFSIIALYNFLWGLFNLVPIPPLDGSHILFSLLPERFAGFKNFLFQYGLFVLIFFLFFGGLEVVFTAAQYLFYFTVGRPFAM